MAISLEVPNLSVHAKVSPMEPSQREHGGYWNWSKGRGIGELKYRVNERGCLIDTRYLSKPYILSIYIKPL